MSIVGRDSLQPIVSSNLTFLIMYDAIYIDDSLNSSLKIWNK